MDSPRRVIDAEKWLSNRVEALIRRRRFGEAIDYLHKLISKVDRERERWRCASYLGYLYLITGDPEAADRWLYDARISDITDPDLQYARGHVAAARGRHSLATVCFLEAFVEAKTPHDEAEFLRSAALAKAGVVGASETIASMLLGALDRDLGNPWILDALARVYEAEERWMETLEALSVLADVVDEGESIVVRREPPARQLLRNQLMGRPARPEELEQRVRAVNEAVRQQFEVVLDDRKRRGPTELAPLRFPPALNRLVRNLEWRQRGAELVELAQNLWARARGAEFDEILGRPRLAAAIQLLVERMHWRVPTEPEDLARLHGASKAAIPAAARVVAGRLGLEPVDQGALRSSLVFEERKRLRAVSRALLVGEGLDQAGVEIRLGG